MPRSSEALHQRQSPRVPLRLKPRAFSEANSLTGAAVDRRTSRTVLQEKQRQSRVGDLETKLGETMVELKLLKEQLELEEAARRIVLKKLEKTKKVVADNLLPVEKDSESCITTDTEENESRMKSEAVMEMAEMKAKLAEKETELETVKKEAEQVSSAERKKNKEMETKLAGTEEELMQSREMLEQMKQKMNSQEGEKEAMEEEMKRLRIQNDQWRKASEAAASILDHESFRSARKYYGEGRAGGGGGGMRVLGELWKKRGQQK